MKVPTPAPVWHTAPARCLITVSAILTLLFASRPAARASTDYGPAVTRLITCAKYNTSGYGKKFAVIHDMEGYYLTGISYLQRCDKNSSGSYNVSVSCHYVVNGLKDYASDAERGEISQLVRESNYAWHARCWNLHSTGTEHEGFASNPAWYTEEMYQASALLHRHLCDKFGIPKDRNHVIAHGQKSVPGWRTWAEANLGIDADCNDHTDPGPYWNWNHYMDLLIGGTDNAAFVSKTVANGANFSPGQAFACTFTMNNNGTTTWAANGGAGYTLNNYSGTLTANTFATPPPANVAPGANANFTVNFTAPTTPGSYTANFQMNSASPSLTYFGAQVPLTINVVSPGPTINTQPVSKTVNPGVNTTFTVAATGSGALSYQWKKNGANLANSTKYGGVTTATLTITNVQQTDVGNYNVNVTDANGTTASASAALAVSTLVAFNETFDACNVNNWGLASNAASIYATMPTSSSAQNHSGSGCSALIDNSRDRMYRNIGAAVAGRGKATFWIYDDSQARVFTEVRTYSGNGWEPGSPVQVLAIGKYNNATMTGETYDSTKYQGRILNGSVNGWFNLNAPGSTNRSTGWHKFEIERLADSSTVNWYVDGRLARQFTGLSSPAWDCVVVGSVGGNSTNGTAGNAWIDDFKVEYYDPPTVNTSPTNKTVVAGNSATFTVTAAGTITGYQWRKNGTNLINGGNISGANSATLTVSNAQAGDATSYDVAVSNGAGPVYSAAATLNVSPKITTQPVGSTNLPASDATFTVAAGGQVTLKYQWRCNGTNLTDGFRILGATGPTLLITGVNQEDEGNYSVVVSNTAGTATSFAVPLVVLDPPIIVTPPADVFIPAGSNATFTVTAAGTAPLFYQWRFNDTNIVGATTSSLNILNAQATDAGGYSVEISNSVDIVISLDAVLAVNTAPVFATVSDRSVHAGSTVLINLSATEIDPDQILSFSLDLGAPANASVNSTNGVFTWPTTVADDGSTNLITAHVTDDGIPPLDHTTSFTITVVSAPGIQSAEVAGGMFTLTWSAIPGKTYRVQYKETFDAADWTDLLPDVTAIGATASQSDPLGPDQRFYRILVLD